MGFTHSLIYIYIFIYLFYIDIEYSHFSRAFFHCVFLQSLSWPKWPVRGNDVQPLPSDFVFPLYLYILYVCKTRKTILAYGHLWQVWMSFMCRSDVISDVVQITWDFQETNLLSRCRPQRMTAEQLSFQQSCFAYCCLKKRRLWQSLWRGVSLYLNAPNTSTASTWAFWR